MINNVFISWQVRDYIETIKGLDACFVCILCGKKFAAYSTCSRHVRGKHLGAQYMCHLCGKISDRSDARKSHMIHFHKLNPDTL